MNALKKFIVLLEDNPGDVYLAKKQLSAHANELDIVHCDNESSLKELLHEYSPDLILADIMLPGYDGREALEYAKVHYPHIPFIFITGSMLSDKAFELIRMGAFDVVFKKDIARIEDAIYRALKYAEEQRKLRNANAINRMLSEISKVGGWEFDVETGETAWSPVVSRIYELDTDEATGVERGIEYYKEGWSRNTIRRCFTEALEQGKDYDEELLLITEKGNEKWVRAIGRPQMVDGKCVRIHGTIQDITQERLRQDKERRQAERHQLVQEVTEAGIWDWNMQTDEAIVDKIGGKLFGYDLDEFATLKDNGDHVFSFGAFRNWIHPDDADAVNTALQDHVLGKTPVYELNHRAVQQDGTVIWVLSKGRIVERSATGEPVRMLGSMINVTEQMAANEKIKQLSLVASKATNGVVITDKDQTMQWVNAGFEKLSGYSSAELLGRKPNMLQGADTSEDARTQLRQAIAEGSPTYVEILNYNMKGQPYWVEIFLDVVKDEMGEVTNFIAIENDITERKKQQAELRKSKEMTEQALHELRHQKFALDQHAIVAITDTKGTIEYVNDKFCEISGYSRDELLGQNHRLLNSGHHPTSMFTQMYQTLAKGQVWKAELRNKAKDGTRYWVDSTITPFIDKGTGKPAKYVAIRTDITQRKKAEDDLNRTLESLEQQVKDRTKDLETTQKALQETHNDLLSSVRYAKRIQQAIIPTYEEVKENFSDVFIIYRPKDIVSGDFYWQYRTENGVFVALIDCTGHGVPGAMMSMLANELLDKVIIDRGIQSPKLILQNLDNELSKLLNRKNAMVNMSDGMDMSVCYIDHQSSTLTYAGAQSHGMYCQPTSGQCIPLVPDKRSIGGMFAGTEKTFHQTIIPYQQGDRFYLYSDGFYDQWGGPEGKKFLRKRFTELLLQTADRSLQEQRNKLLSTLDNWKGNETQADDITVLAIQL